MSSTRLLRLSVLCSLIHTVFSASAINFYNDPQCGGSTVGIDVPDENVCISSDRCTPGGSLIYSCNGDIDFFSDNNCQSVLGSATFAGTACAQIDPNTCDSANALRVFGCPVPTGACCRTDDLNGTICTDTVQESDCLTSDGTWTAGVTCDSDPCGGSGPVCGNGNLEAGEECDDGNTVSGDGCFECMQECSSGTCSNWNNKTCDADNDCTVTITNCAQLTLGVNCIANDCSSNDECPLGYVCNLVGKCSATIFGTCPENCRSINGICENAECRPTCGNGIVEEGEECDDGNTASGDGCDMACQLEQVCGNGIIEAPEQCDDNNTAGGDGCSATCTCETPSIVTSVSTAKYCNAEDKEITTAAAEATNTYTDIVRFQCAPGHVLVGCTAEFPTAGPVECQCKRSVAPSNPLLQAGEFYFQNKLGCSDEERVQLSLPRQQLICDNGLFCDGLEQCVFNTTTCDASCTAPGSPCTTVPICGSIECNDNDDTCDFTPDDADCTEGTFCFPLIGFFPEGNPGRCSPDCNNNGIPDEDDIALETSKDENANGVPDECDGCSYTQGYWKNAENSQALPDFSYQNATLTLLCLDRSTELLTQCVSLFGLDSDECAALQSFLSETPQSFCNNLDEYFGLSYPQQGNLRRTDCAKLQRQLFAFLMNTFLGAIGDIPPYTELGAHVPDSLLEEVVDFISTYPNIFDARTCFDEQPLTNVERQALIDFARLLDQYNTGELPGGVQHCDSEQECGYITFLQTNFDVLPGMPCGGSPSFVASDGKCEEVNVGTRQYHLKVLCRDNEVTVQFADRDNCGGRKTQFRESENSCFLIEANPIGSGGNIYMDVNCSGCPDPDLIEAMLDTAAAQNSPVQQNAVLQNGSEDDDVSSSRGITIAALVLAILAFLIALGACVFICCRNNGYRVLGTDAQKPRTFGDHIREKQSFA